MCWEHRTERYATPVNCLVGAGDVWQQLEKELQVRPLAQHQELPWRAAVFPSWCFHRFTVIVWMYDCGVSYIGHIFCISFVLVSQQK